MPLGFGGDRNEDVVSLIAAKKYARAIEVLKTQLQKRGANPSLRMQLADVLILSGKTSEAIGLLLPLADQYARDGFAAKAISVLKKIQKIDPDRSDVEGRLAQLIEEKQRHAVVLPLSKGGAEIGIEEIGIEAEAVSVAHTPADTTAAPELTPQPPPPPAAPETPEPVIALAEPAPVVLLGAAQPSAAAEIEDYDLLYYQEPGGDEGEEEEILVAVPEDEEGAEPMSDIRFADELMSLVDSVFQDTSAAGARATAPTGAPPKGGAQIVVSPLFRDFSVDEMVAVIHGLKLLSFERGQAIIREDQPGASLFMLTSGRVRAFRKDPKTGQQVRLADLREGAFFGEGSILTGKPRTASIVALSRCELLELDRGTLDEITKTHPHVWDVLREFAAERARAARPGA